LLPDCHRKASTCQRAAAQPCICINMQSTIRKKQGWANMINQGLVVRAALGAGLLALASCQSGSSGGTAQSPPVVAGSTVAEAPLAAEEAGEAQTAEIKTQAGPATGAVLALTDPGPD